MISRLKSYYAHPRFRIALAVGVLGAGIFALVPRSPHAVCYFEVTMRSSLPGTAHLHYVPAPASNDRDSVQVAVQGGNSDRRYQFLLREGKYSRLWFQPIDQGSATLTLSEPRIVDRSQRVIRSISPGDISPVTEAGRFEIRQGEISFTAAPHGEAPVLAVDFVPPLAVRSFASASLKTFGRRFLSSFFLFAIAGLLIPPPFVSRVKSIGQKLYLTPAGWVRAQPPRVVVLVAVAAVAVSCYPVVFFGKSFLSPNNHSHTFLLYPDMPTVPGYTQEERDDARGSDMGSALWYSWPASVVESRALFRNFELPLWNRYNSMGLPLLGQGQSMFGDPLHLIALLGNGSPFWWDLKYLLAKVFFAACVGLSVLQLTKHLPSAAASAMTAPFIGFFCYRYSHPAFFTLCYAPFIFLCWLKLVDAPNRRNALVWSGLTILANWMVLTSGTVKEAYIELLALNMGGCLALFFTVGTQDRFWKFRQVLYAQILFVLISAPIWLTFLKTLQVSSTFYDLPEAYQLQPGIVIGLFDDIFYRELNTDELHLDPSLNFFVLSAVLWLCFSLRGRESHRRLSGLTITSVMSMAIVFGLVPRSLITHIPFLQRIHHVDNTFSCVAIVCLLVLAGCGVKAFWQDCQAGRFRKIYPQFLFLIVGLFLVYLATTGVFQRSTFLRMSEHIPKSSFFWGYSLVLVLAAALLPAVARLAILRRRTPFPALFTLALLLFLLHWRHGMHLQTAFDAYVMNPQQRVNLLAASSEALKLIKGRSSEPSRAAGLGLAFSPGYGGAVGIEQIDSSDPLLNPYYRILIDTFGTKLPFASSLTGVLGEDLTSSVPLLDMLNLRYYLGSTNKADLAPSVKRIATVDLNVYESGSAWPRAFFTDRLIPYGSDVDFISLLRRGDGKPFAAIPQPEWEAQPRLHSLRGESSSNPERQVVAATNYVLTNNSTSFNVTAPGPGTVVLTEPYIKDEFQLTVNGKRASYFRVNSAFRGVFVPAAGEYRFSFSYWPSHLTVSLWISALGVALLGVWGVRQWNLSRSST
jgi:hypothetical protein